MSVLFNANSLCFHCPDKRAYIYHKSGENNCSVSDQLPRELTDQVAALIVLTGVYKEENGSTDIIF